MPNFSASSSGTPNFLAYARMHASTARACLRKLSDWVYSHSKPQADSRFCKVLYLFSPGFLPVFRMYYPVTVDICIDIKGIYTAKLLRNKVAVKRPALVSSKT